MKKCDKAISEKMILYLPYVKPSQYLNEKIETNSARE
jgi:hypothetical protein